MKSGKMLRVALTQIVIFGLLMMSMSYGSPGQSVRIGKEIAPAHTAQGTVTLPDFTMTVAKVGPGSLPKIDPKAMAKIGRQQPRKEGLSTKQKWAIALGIAGTAALVYVLVRNASSACVVTGQTGCVGVNVNCTCRE